MMYAQGLGVAQDRNQAIQWFRKAAANGDPDSKQVLQTLGVQ
jgi:TPR repeat protein